MRNKKAQFNKLTNSRFYVFR